MQATPTDDFACTVRVPFAGAAAGARDISIPRDVLGRRRAAGIRLAHACCAGDAGAAGLVEYQSGGSSARHPLVGPTGARVAWDGDGEDARRVLAVYGPNGTHSQTIAVEGSRDLALRVSLGATPGSEAPHEGAAYAERKAPDEDWALAGWADGMEDAMRTAILGVATPTTGATGTTLTEFVIALGRGPFVRVPAGTDWSVNAPHGVQLNFKAANGGPRRVADFGLEGAADGGFAETRSQATTEGARQPDRVVLLHFDLRAIGAPPKSVA